MKHLATILTMAITFTGLAQQMPYNPDANGDDFVGVDDVLGVLGMYDTDLLQPDLQCDYEGTGLEAFFGGIFNDEIVLDSIYVEYLYSDSVETFIAGCPDPVMIETVLERSILFSNPNTELNASFPNVYCYSNYLGYGRTLIMGFNPDDGRYQLNYGDDEAAYITPYPSHTGWLNSEVPMPFDESWQLTDDGIQVDWDPNRFLGNCESVRIIPFWHEAE